MRSCTARAACPPCAALEGASSGGICPPPCSGAYTSRMVSIKSNNGNQDTTRAHRAHPATEPEQLNRLQSLQAVHRYSARARSPPTTITQ